MAIKIKRDELERQGAKVHSSGVIPFKALPVKQPENDALVAKVVDALVAATNEQRAEIVRAVSANEKIASALADLKRPEGWNGSWNVHITKRDVLGRISEVQFTPAKP